MPIDRNKPYSKQDISREFRRLKVTPYTEFYQNFLVKFNMPDVQYVEDILKDPQGVARIEKATHNEPLVTDELSYLQFCLQSIAGDYRYRVSATWIGSGSSRDEQQEVFTKNRQSDGFVEEIRNALYQSDRLPPHVAKDLLKKVIAKIKRSSATGFFRMKFAKLSRILKSMFNQFWKRYNAINCCCHHRRTFGSRRPFILCKNKWRILTETLIKNAKKCSHILSA